MAVTKLTVSNLKINKKHTQHNLHLLYHLGVWKSLLLSFCFKSMPWLIL